MKYIVFTKRQISPESRAIANTPFSVLFNQEKNLQVCVLKGEEVFVEMEFNSLTSRTDLLVVELLSGEMDLPESSVNAWLWRKLSQVSVRALSIPSH